MLHITCHNILNSSLRIPEQLTLATNSPDVLSDTVKKYSSLQHLPHSAAHKFFPTSALGFFTCLNSWAFAFGDNKNLYICFAQQLHQQFEAKHFLRCVTFLLRALCVFL